MEDEYEYNLEGTDVNTGHVVYWRALWESDVEWLTRKLAYYKEYNQKILDAGEEIEYTYVLVRRRKAGPVEKVEN